MAKEKKISIFDPFANAYREVTIEVAKKFVSESAEVAKKIAEVGADNG